LINSENGVSRTVLVLILIILFLLTVFVNGLVAEFLYVGFVSVRVIIVANNSGIGRDDLTILNNDLEAKGG
jgi:type IV secretory pathway VirB3-like protein